MKNKPLDKSFESIGYILDISQFDSYQSIYNSYNVTNHTFSPLLAEAILECDLKGFEQINLAKKDYLNSSLFKPGNILLIPYNHDDLGWYLSPWKILQIRDNNVMLNCMHVLFSCGFDETSRVKVSKYTCWKNSTLRDFLNSKVFLDNFPRTIQLNIDFHEIWTNNEVTSTSDRFWLLSWQDLGEVGNNEEYKRNFIKDYPDLKLKFYNIDVFKSNDDLIKYDISKKTQLHYWLRSSTIKYKTCVGCVGANGYLNPFWDYDSPLGCAPVFILNNDVYYNMEDNI